VAAGSFYDGIMRELVFALGAAMFVACAAALYRRKSDAQAAAHRTVARHRAGSPVRGYRRAGEASDLTQAPVARTVTYMILGFVVMVVGLASMVAMH
jgi:hypothetical protein